MAETLYPHSFYVMKSKVFLNVTLLIVICIFNFQNNIYGQDYSNLKKIMDDANKLFEQGKYKDSLPLNKHVLSIFEKELGSENLHTASAINTLALNYICLGEHQAAIPLLNKSLAIIEKKRGLHHPETATILNNLADVYSYLGDYGKSLELYKRSLSIREKALGSNHPITASTLDNLGALHGLMGELLKAESLHKKSLNIIENTYGPQSIETGRSLMFLAKAKMALGDYTKALPLFERTLKIYEKKLGIEHPFTAVILNDLAVVYKSIGNFPQADYFYNKALEIYKRTLGMNHQSTARCLNNLAELYLETGQSEKALPLYQHALVIHEKNLGPEHPDTMIILNNLALCYESIGESDKALLLFKRSLTITEKNLGPLHPNAARTLNNMATLYRSMGDYAKAEPLFDKSSSILNKSLGKNHPNFIMTLENNAMINYEIENNEKSLALCNELYYAKMSSLQSILNLDEQSRLLWQNKNLKYWVSCIFEPAMVAQLALNWKGVILDSLLEDRVLALVSGKRSEGAQNLQKIAELRTRLSKILFEQGKEKEKSDLEAQISLLQRNLAQTYLGREMQRPSLNHTMSDIAPSLSGGVILLDFIHFHDPKKIKNSDNQCVGAIITGEDNRPVLVRLDEAADIHRAVEDLRKAINQSDAEAVQQFTTTLSEKLWTPIAAKIPQQVNRLIISPDGELNFLSFAALLDGQGKFLAETYDISYMGSARDLVRETKSMPSRTLRLFANPAFQRAPSEVNGTQLNMRSAEIDLFGQLQLPPLPGTEKESAEIQKIATDAGWKLQTFTQEQADEQALRKTKKPGILHLATHGFYLNTFLPAPLDSRGMSVIKLEKPKLNTTGVDPMRASGIALAGAQATLQSWGKRKAPAPETDGVLTAEEVSALDLDGTWLVTLSACETGVGEAQSGEGVFGLRRSFMMAGTENLLMTLWPVRDESTSEIMADFYREALKTGNAPGSLAKVQREWLVKLRKEKGLLEAVRDAGPFVMATIGKPLPPLPRNAEESQASLKQLN